MRLCWWKLVFPLHMVINWTWLLGFGWDLVSPLHWTLSSWEPHVLCKCCSCLWFLMGANPAVFRQPWFLNVLYFHWLLQFSVSYISGFPDPWWVRFDEDTPLRIDCCKARLLSVHCPTVSSVFLPIYCRRKNLWQWLGKSLVFEYSRVSLSFF